MTYSRQVIVAGLVLALSNRAHAQSVAASRVGVVERSHLCVGCTSEHQVVRADRDGRVLFTDVSTESREASTEGSSRGRRVAVGAAIGATAGALGGLAIGSDAREREEGFNRGVYMIGGAVIGGILGAVVGLVSR